jgi:ubiquinone/menaquinone biosynthesis C-methylase UbiE
MTAAGRDDVVKQQVAAHWGRRAAHFDEDFGHSIRTSADRAAWDRILDLVIPAGARSVLDVGCGTGFLGFELAARGRKVVGIDFAPAMIAEARRKAGERGIAVTFEEGDAERLRFDRASFDLVISRHLLWTLPHPEAAIDEWVRVLRPGGRLVVIDSQPAAAGGLPPRENARTSEEYAAIADRLPFLAGRSREEIVGVLKGHGLVNVASDPLADLVAAQEQRAVAEGREPMRRLRYVVWGDVSR